MWLRAIESDLKPLNIGPSYTWKKAAAKTLAFGYGHGYIQEEYAMERENPKTQNWEKDSGFAFLMNVCTSTHWNWILSIIKE